MDPLEVLGTFSIVQEGVWGLGRRVRGVAGVIHGLPVGLIVDPHVRTPLHRRRTGGPAGRPGPEPGELVVK